MFGVNKLTNLCVVAEERERMRMMSITPEICTSCGQTVSAEEDYKELWKKFLIVKNALVQCNTAIDIFKVKNITDKALKNVL